MLRVLRALSPCTNIIRSAHTQISNRHQSEAPKNSYNSRCSINFNARAAMRENNNESTPAIMRNLSLMNTPIIVDIYEWRVFVLWVAYVICVCSSIYMEIMRAPNATFRPQKYNKHVILRRSQRERLKYHKIHHRACSSAWKRGILLRAARGPFIWWHLPNTMFSTPGDRDADSKSR